ncbi:GGDEF domain-containing protein [Gluconobacter sp. Dm-62]|uniref:GGDEF domain-containing protein n=1 Tax=Gluconobacter sp. Dm-62 TaxID=2799804 RepID=UPI001B8CA572|nr:GGDEF domain-containing protein [Gluconobacter sp. Dm-62]MBS1101585.1 GGDEF domain-containing protein [Gluconobacter sp. Dm-62]
MSPDPPTLLGCSAVIFLLLGVHFILSELSSRQWSRMAWYAAPFLLGSVSGLFFTVPATLPGLWGLRLGALFMLLAYGTAWQAMRVMLGCQSQPLIVLLTCSASFMLSILAGPTGLVHVVSTAFRLAAIASFHIFAACGLRHNLSIRTPARRTLLKLLNVYAGFHLLLVPFVLWIPAPLGAAPTTIWAVTTYNFLAIIEVALFALAMIAIPWEQLAFRQQELILQDPLSGGSNRRAFQSWLENNGKICTREALLMVDIDHFKSINDAHGHAVGDQIITAMGRVCTDILYPPTVLFRIGGDEFVVVFQCASPEEMLATAQRLRKAFRTETRIIGGAAVAATLSIGAALCPGTGIARTELLARADSALYAAKQTGRDRVVHFPWEDEEMSPAPANDPTAIAETGL